jgi:crotonobetainyl-CoA:carnitine CoA-transferase CaiB-like acyl-CoA transferase
MSRAGQFAVQHLRVIDFAHAYAGPFCMHHLQLYGADVVKIEPQGRADAFRERPPVTAAINAGKATVKVTSAGLVRTGRIAFAYGS